MSCALLRREDIAAYERISHISMVKPAANIQVVDFVLDPFIYHDALIESLREGQHEGDALDHLASVLPVAIAQLDAVGDAYGAMALGNLYEHVAGLEALA